MNKKVFWFRCCVFLFLLIALGGFSVYRLLFVSLAVRSLPGTASAVHEYSRFVHFNGDGVYAMKALLPLPELEAYVARMGMSGKLACSFEDIPFFDVPVEWWNPQSRDGAICYVDRVEDDCVRTLVYSNGHVYVTEAVW